MRELESALIKELKATCQRIMDVGPSINAQAQAYTQAVIDGDRIEMLANSYGYTLPQAYAKQILYIQSNLNTWRGDEAREVKADLKRLQKQLDLLD